MHLRLFALAVLALPLFASAAEPIGQLNLPSFTGLQSKASEVVDITLGAWPLALASKFMNADDPKDAEVAYQLALTYARQGRLEQTLSWARQARELGPLDPAPVALEGDIHALRGQHLDAERVWKQCLQVRPGDPGCVRRLEQLKSRSGS